MDDVLRAAIQRRDLAALQRRIAEGADVRARDDDGGTALHLVAIFWGDLQAADLLLAAGAEVDAADDRGETPLAAAVTMGHYRDGASGKIQLLSLVERLLARGASARAGNRDRKSAIVAALEQKHAPLVRLLVKHGAELPVDAMLLALSPGAAQADPETVALVAQTARPDQLAARKEDGSTLLHVAAESARTVGLMRWLIDRQADVHALKKDGSTPLVMAALHGNLPGLALLAERGAAIEVVTRDGTTPLHVASHGLRLDVLQWLVQRGASLAATDRWGRRPLDVALVARPFAFMDEAGKREIVALLGGSEADLARGAFRNHPLHVAIRNLDLASVEKQLAAGTNVNTRNEEGETPLRAALEMASQLPLTPAQRAFGRRLLPLLFEHGADTTLRMPGSMKTYDELAAQLGLESVVARLKRSRR